MRAWVALGIAAVFAVALVDAAVLQVIKGYFGSGYNATTIGSLGEFVAFFALGAFMDTAILAIAWAVTVPLVARLGARGSRLLVWSLALAGAIPLVGALALHQLHRTLGDVLHLGIVWDLAAGDAGNALGEMAQDLPPLLLGLAAFALVGGLAAALAARVERGIGQEAEPPSSRGLLALGVASALFATLGLAASQRVAPDVHYGLSWKPAGVMLSGLADQATDWDRDGAGWLARPADPDGWDAARHPGALETAGNRIDENGLGGDLPPGFAAPPVVPAPTAAGAALPTRPVLLIFLESFRADLLFAEHDGREVTPFLNGLARDGAYSDEAFVHQPMTWTSRAQLFQGRLVPRLGSPTLVDDFHERGYEVAWFSGQHDGARGGSALLGAERADVFADARDDLDRRTSRSAQPISLQVSWQTVAARAERFLAEREKTRPLFLYVNLVDTHFPYHHDQLEAILETEPLPRSAIARENRTLVWEAYLNAAANVDRAIERVVTSAREHLGDDLVVVVTSDHGQAFYEARHLGHGQALDRIQTQVPLVVTGLGGRWPEPFGLADLRGSLLGSLASPHEALRFEPEPERRILQTAGRIEAPKLLGLRGLDGAIVFEPISGRAYAIAPDDRERDVPADDPRVVDVIHSWEAARIEAEGER